MELTLSAIAIISFVVFIITWLIIAIAAFRHHIVTGLIALFPVLNIMIYPTILGKIPKTLMLSLLSLFALGIAWFAGAKDHLPLNGPYTLSALTQGKQANQTSHEPVTFVSSNNAAAATGHTLTVSNTASHNALTNSNNTQVAVAHLRQTPQYLSPVQTTLPNKALYYLLFEEVERKNWDHLKDSLIRITFEDETSLEGRVANILPDRLVIKYHRNQQTQTFETPTSRIIHLEKLVKQPSV